jgi:hypothetical protein
VVGLDEIVEDIALCRQVRQQLRRGKQAELFALTIHRPHAQSLIHGPRRIEGRDWLPEEYAPVELGHWIVIHAGKTFDFDGWNSLLLSEHELGWRPPQSEEECRTGIIGVAKLSIILDRSTDPWAVPGKAYYWRFSRVVSFPSPIPCRGREKLWPVLGDLRQSCRVQWRLARRYAK